MEIPTLIIEYLLKWKPLMAGNELNVVYCQQNLSLCFPFSVSIFRHILPAVDAEIIFKMETYNDR